MDKQILEILMDLQKGLTVVSNDLTGVKNDLAGVQKDLKDVKIDIHEIKETVNRIEVSQTEDVIGILKVNKKKTDLEVDYLNSRLTEMDKRIYILEKNMHN
ncbi:hypothetical protein V7654_12760 [Bacillus sp. JJ1609]|uniref:hypothetical protein n=1 Tax=Bacillus sp. JJ1609 TaxID=3122977 RepID=UPI003000044F